MNDFAYPSVEYWVEHLQLQPHPEGGYYQTVARGNCTVSNQKSLPRYVYTTIYFLLTPESPSHLHRLCSDETWFFHAGDPLLVHVLLENPTDDELVLRPGSPLSAKPQSPLQAVEMPEDYPLNTPFVPTHLRPSETSPTEAAYHTNAHASYQHYRCVPVGPRVHVGEVLQYTVPAKAIFGSSVAPGGKAGYSLVSCQVSPGFDFRDFELFTQADLMKICPQHEEMIRAMAYASLPLS